ncbi:DUF4249 domain-containing protein [Sphingobacterium paucimobilis]|uniref:DUF4249 domain-containing protein n=1 Tax=Sphingobacterium paucimobilis HER1398 TaxID=1346330 RepID=U2I176_9SPHI|nr:DUF4249 domain-containing protein [Sphingobacterium paucimobilis]ERJ61280.1 hypothetical protein M472_21230 [Sphingobacterium paucimobilis HER1398]
MKLLRFYIFLSVAFLMASCEDLIEVDLNSANPKIVIEADLNDLGNQQVIRLSRTVDFSSPISSEAISGAKVAVMDSKGQLFNFVDKGDGIYLKDGFKPVVGLSYDLTVKVGDEIYQSSTNMNPFVPVDSIAVKEETVFNKTYYSVVLKFNDPKDVPNYYKYDIAINGKEFKFASAYSDKFNDGLYVSHQITDRDNSIELGDSVVVRRQCIAKEVYTYWNQIQMMNPGSAAPANPTSNLSNGALGYFSVSSAKEYGIRIVKEND